MKTFTKLTDESIMPWGKYKGEELQDVPASYLNWIEGQLKNQKTDDPFRNGLLVYINDNRDVLDKELKK